MKAAGASLVIARSVSDEAIQSEAVALPQSLDCFVTAFLAMTAIFVLYELERLFQK